MSIAANETHRASISYGGELRRTDAPECRIGPDEQLITLTEATRHLPKVDGKKPAVCTLWQSRRRGCLARFRRGAGPRQRNFFSKSDPKSAQKARKRFLPL